MRKGKIHQVTSTTNQIGNIIITSNKLSLTHSKRRRKAMWSTVNKLRGKIPPANANSNIDADKFNSYFASISNSSNYIEPTHKVSAPHNINYITSSTVYYILYKSCLKEQDLMVSQAGFSNLFLLQSVSPCQASTTTASSRHFFQLSGKIVLFTPLKK